MFALGCSIPALGHSTAITLSVPSKAEDEIPPECAG